MKKKYAWIAGAGAVIVLALGIGLLNADEGDVNSASADALEPGMADVSIQVPDTIMENEPLTLCATIVSMNPDAYSQGAMFSFRVQGGTYSYSNAYNVSGAQGAGSVICDEDAKTKGLPAGQYYVHAEVDGTVPSIDDGFITVTAYPMSLSVTVENIPGGVNVCTTVEHVHPASTPTAIVVPFIEGPTVGDTRQFEGNVIPLITEGTVTKCAPFTDMKEAGDYAAWARLMPQADGTDYTDADKVVFTMTESELGSAPASRG